MATTSIAETREANCQPITKLNQLEAFMLMTFGAGREAFTQMASAPQDDYLAACTDIVQACQELTVTIAAAVHENVSTEVGHG